MPSSIVLNGTTGIANATWTTATRPASPVAGQSGYNTTIGAMETYTGSTWSTSDLPAPSTAGNVLTSNGTSWTSQTPATPNVSGGATITSSAVDITLTSSSNRVQNISMTANSKAVILPDATTLSAGGPTFLILNNGVISFVVKNNSGAVLQTVAPNSSILLSLASTSTSDGRWDLSTGGELGIGQYTNAVTISSNAASDTGAYGINYTTGYNQQTAYMNPTMTVIGLTSTTALFVYTRTNGNVYAVVITNSSGTLSVGTEVLVYTGTTTPPSMVAATVLSSTAAFVYICRSGTTNFTYPLVIAGTTITVGTASAAWGLTGGSNLCAQVAMDSTTALISQYGQAGTASYYVRTMIHNGTSAPTVGTGTVLTGTTNMTENGMCKLTSTTAFYAYDETLNARVITISGSSAPTLGTNVTIPAPFSTTWRYGMSCFAYSPTEVVVVSGLGTGYGYAVYTVSGTTLTLLVSATSNMNGAGKVVYYDANNIFMQGSFDDYWYKLKYINNGTANATIAVSNSVKQLSSTYYTKSAIGQFDITSLDGTNFLAVSSYASTYYPYAYLVKSI